MKKIFFLLCIAYTQQVICVPEGACIKGKCNKDYCLQPRWIPRTVYDYTTMFNEKRYWLEINQSTGDVQMCYQRLDIYPEYFMTPTIHCFRALPVMVPEEFNEIGKFHCWKADQTIICQNDETGDLMLHQGANN